MIRVQITIIDEDGDTAKASFASSQNKYNSAEKLGQLLGYALSAVHEYVPHGDLFGAIAGHLGENAYDSYRCSEYGKRP